MENLGTRNFCAYCEGSTIENGEMVCRDREGRFYGFPVKSVLNAPCIRPKNENRGE